MAESFADSSNSLKFTSPGDTGSSGSDIDYEGIPALGVGQRKTLKVTTYIELHSFIIEITKIFEEIFEMGILKGTAKQAGTAS